MNEERDSGSRYDQRQRDANRGGDRGRGRGRGREDVGNGYNYHNVAPNYSSSSTTGRMSGYGTYLDSAFGRVSGSGGGGGGSHRQTTEQQFSDRSRERDRERDGFRESDRSGGSGTHWQHGRAGAGNGLGSYTSDACAAARPVLRCSAVLYAVSYDGPEKGSAKLIKQS